MAQAVTARRDGDAFQARVFWLKAARLLDPDSPVVRVGFESGEKSFDDVWVEYAPNRGERDRHGRHLIRINHQCKWHTAPGTFGFADLINPEFINAAKHSFLQRAHTARGRFSASGTPSRYGLVTNWRIHPDDALRTIVCQRSTAIRTERLFDGTTDRSATGQLRKSWREHLGIDEGELELLAGTLAVAQASDSLDHLRDHLDALFAFVGLRRIPAEESTFPYDNLPFDWMGQKRTEFDRSSFRAACADENLIIGAPQQRRPTYGVKSFVHAIDPIEQRCTVVTDLLRHFEDRFIKDPDAWRAEIYPELRTFLLQAARESEQVRLVFDAHASIAFASGSILDVKCGRDIEIEQRGAKGREIWSATDRESETSWPAPAFETVIVGEGPEIAVTVGLTHDVRKQVGEFVPEQLPAVGRIINCTVPSGTGQTSVKCGRHAFDVVEAIIREVVAARRSSAFPHMHIFIAAPNVVTFFLGQRHALLGPVTLYEYDFEQSRGGGYLPSLLLSI
jgi:hypothetical protein